MSVRGPWRHAALPVVLCLGLVRPTGAAEAPSGARHQTMRALAAYLDETSQGLVEGASDTVLQGSASEARFLTSIRAFARSARDLRAAIDGQADAPFDLDARLAALAEVARALDERLQSARILDRTRPEWVAVQDVLDRMRRSLGGADVTVPDAYVVPALAGERLQRFRELAAALEESAARTHARAREKMGAYQDRGPQFLGELHYFAAASQDLRARSAAEVVSQPVIGRFVAALLVEARAADRRMRDAKVFTEAWEDSSRSITILQQMAGLVRS
jgi:hypothetical protein